MKLSVLQASYKMIRRKQMNARKWLTIGGSILLAGLALAVMLSASNSAQAGPLLQGPDGEDEEAILGSTQAANAVYNAVVYQGRLTDSGGNPINDTLDITLTLYADSAGTTQLCQDKDNNQSVDNGLFTFYLDGSDRCTPNDINGRAVYLGVQVEGNDEMTPRRAIYPVPYAFSLRPGAIIMDDANDDPVLWVENAYDNTSADAVGLVARGDPAGIFTGTVDNTFTEGAYGVIAQGGGLWGSGGKFSGAVNGIHAEGELGAGGYFKTGLGYGIQVECDGGVAGADIEVTGSGDALILTSGSGDLIEGFGGGSERDFRVTASGYVYADGSYNCGLGGGCFNTGTGADVAERIDATGTLEPSDVVEIDPDNPRHFRLSRTAYSTLVAGVVSTNPAITMNNNDLADNDTGERTDGRPLLALVGQVPVKVSAENGPIQPGDLLVASSTPGHAMRAGDDPPQGTVLGKALGALEEGTGVIEMLVMLQ
jgi:hypothetical protein